MGGGKVVAETVEKAHVERLGDLLRLWSLPDWRMRRQDSSAFFLLPGDREHLAFAGATKLGITSNPILSVVLFKERPSFK